MSLFGRTFDCPFCVLTAEGRSPVWSHLFPAENGDEVILESSSFLAVLDTAPLAEGHLLIIPDRHVTALASLPEPERDELQDVKHVVESMLKEVYGPVLYFEHGAESRGRHAGACIDHAHLHLVPGDADLLPHVARDYPDVRVFASYGDALDGLAGGAYVMFGRQAGRVYGASAPVCVTQYLRRLVARQTQPQAGWNWRDAVRWADALGVREQLLAARTKLLGQPSPR
ncbi:HIT family protein [Nonomuraea sp. NPDC049309]|jgi:diadenosine tetraphosphate (Ap4A) HIT family hydrolase|uniref:HIT family protein n=1 Tax=Nonomuraea sp. NPDC049309 TaxID=3364350 RepID=UPI003713BBC6